MKRSGKTVGQHEEAKTTMKNRYAVRSSILAVVTAAGMPSVGSVVAQENPLAKYLAVPGAVAAERDLPVDRRHHADLHPPQSDRVKDYCLSNPTSTVMDAFAKASR